MMKTLNKLYVLIILLIMPFLTFAQEEDEETNGDNDYYVNLLRVNDSIYMLKGKGGNIAVQIGREGVLIVDSQFEASVPHIVNTISKLSTKNIRFLINTHHHGDHVGGNGLFKDLGAISITQNNSRNRLLKNEIKDKSDSLQKTMEGLVEDFKSKGMTEEEASKSAKEAVASMDPFSNNNYSDNPLAQTITFNDEMNIFYNGEKILLTHLHNAHTDGDAIVFFTKSNVIHTGDAFVQGGYPFIDIENGGSSKGYITGLSKILMLADDETKIIPGHGNMATVKDVNYTKRMMEFLTSRIEFYYVSGKTLEDILADKEMTREFDNKGFGDGFISTKKLITTLYNEIDQKYKRKNRER